jgi:polysaccharide export outer membrane protein
MMKKLLMSGFGLLLMLWMSVAGAVDVPLGSGDVLKISVYGNPDLSLETRVSESGSITFPMVGEVAVGGLTPAAAEKLIASRLQSGGFVRKAEVNILVTQFQGQLVSVLGQVNRPGRYPIDGKRNLTDILALAGGASATGADTVDLIRTRNGKTTKEVINIVDMMQKGTLNQDLELAGGDLIFVERAPMFYIYGEVQKPGTYRLEPNMTGALCRRRPDPARYRAQCAYQAQVAERETGNAESTPRRPGAVE